MEIKTRVRISSNFIIIKIVFIVVTILLLKLLIEDRNSDIDFKTITEYKIYLVASITFLLYFLTRPIIYHDEVNLYIKKVNKKEITVPLRKIHSIFINYIGGRGSSNNSIEYLDIDNAKDSIKFNSPYNASAKLANFIEAVKRNNPKVEIV